MFVGTALQNGPQDFVLGIVDECSGDLGAPGTPGPHFFPGRKGVTTFITRETVKLLQTRCVRVDPCVFYGLARKNLSRKFVKTICFLPRPLVVSNFLEAFSF